MTSEELLKQAQDELYTALEAIEKGDLPFARSSSQRASGLIIDAWQKDRPKGIVQLTRSTQPEREVKLASRGTSVGRSVVANLLSPTDD